MKSILITNNSLVVDKLNSENLSESTYKLVYDEGYSFIDVLKKTRDFIHQGHVLLTHPISGSVKPYETPFKSVAISLVQGELDNTSLEIIENAIQITETFLRDYRQREFSDKIYDDFRLIDYSLIKSGIDQMNKGSIIIH